MKKIIKNTISYSFKTLIVAVFVFLGAKAFASEMVTLSVSNITTNSATINARVVNVNTDTVVRGLFEYDTNPSFVSSSYTEETVITLSSTKSYSQTIVGLNPNTTYYVRALGIGNNEGVAKPGFALTFKTDSNTTNTKPNASMVTANATGQNTATVSMYYDDGDTGSVDVWFEYGTSTSFGSNTVIFSKSDFGNHTENISGLNPNTTYYVRAVARNSLGTTYSIGALSFTTDSSGTGGGGTINYIYGCTRVGDARYNPNANFHVESYCAGNNNNNWGNNWNNWFGGGTLNNDYKHDQYINPDDIKSTSVKSSNTANSNNRTNRISLRDRLNEREADVNKYLASAFFGLGNGFLPTSLLGWLLLIFLILLLIVLTRHYFFKKPIPVITKK